MNLDKLLKELEKFKKDFEEAVSMIVFESQVIVQIRAYDYRGLVRFNVVIINLDKGCYEIERDYRERSYMPELTKDVSNILNKYGFKLEAERIKERDAASWFF